MSPNSIIFWGIAWSLVGGLGLLVTAAWNVRPGGASTRHFFWRVTFVAVAVVPAIMTLGWTARRPELGETAAPDTPLNPGAYPTCPAPDSSGTRQPTLGHGALGVWLAGTLWTIGRMVVALRGLRRWHERSDGYHLPPELPADAFENVIVRIAADDSPEVPITFGFLRPVILLPRSARAWGDSRLGTILWHELGHIRRGDNLFQRLVLLLCALHWFNPIFWFAARQMHREAEIAADDFAIRRGIKPSRYAAELLAVAAELHSEGGPKPIAHTAMVPSDSLEQRLRSILDPRTSRGNVPGLASAIALTLLAGWIVLLVGTTPILARWFHPLTAVRKPECVTAPTHPQSHTHAIP